MKPRLVFIDDDQRELDDMGGIVREEYDYHPALWPLETALDSLLAPRPDVILLDLYFPSDGVRAAKGIPAPVLQEQANAAREISLRFSRLYGEQRSPKDLLRETFSCIRSSYDLLWQQCQELGQSPENGRELLARIRADKKFRDVPIIFYSRKVTVEEAVRALQAGAAAVIPKPDSPPDRTSKEQVLAQIRAVRELSRAGWRLWVAQRLLPMNVNVTIFSQDFVGQKATLALFGGR